jgi:transposase-like protein
MYLLRAVDRKREVLELPVQSRSDQRAAVRLMRKLLMKQRITPEELATDWLRAYEARRASWASARSASTCGARQPKQPRE